MEDMELFYMVQLAKTTQDQYLQQKIDYEIKMRDGTAKLLAASKHPQQMLEAAKNLLTSNTRMIAYMSELQRRKTDEVMKKRSSQDGNQVPCKAKVSVSDIRIPLMWKDVDHFKNKGDHRRYAVFCILKIGTEIYDTTLIKDVDRNMTDLTFEDIVVFNDISPDFECHLEVYSHRLLDDLTIASTPKRLKKKFNELSTSVGRSVGKRLSGIKDDPEFMANMLVGPKFEQLASATLKLKDIDDTIGTFELKCEPENNTDGSGNTELPLFGHFCCRLAAQPACLVSPTTVGNLHVKAGDGNWQWLWCVLKELRLACWEREEDVDVIPPTHTIPVTKESEISGADPSACEKEHSFHIRSRPAGSSTSSLQGSLTSQFTLAADSEEELTQWWDGLQQHMLDQALWQHACDKNMKIKAASPQKLPAFMKRGSNLYDDTPWKDSPVKIANMEESPVARVLGRLDIEDDDAPALVSRTQCTIETDV